jgi:hypothetical protein
MLLQTFGALVGPLHTPIYNGTLMLESGRSRRETRYVSPAMLDLAVAHGMNVARHLTEE